jgi:putative ABC transport system permease protein
MKTWAARFRWLFRRQRFEREMEAELRFHLECQTQEHIANGLSPEQARAAAQRSLGSVAYAKDVCRDSFGLRMIDELRQDLRYAVRHLRENRGFAVAAIVTLALGIGANATVFTIVNAVLLRSLPVDHPQQIVWLDTTDTRGRWLGVSRQDFEDWRRATRTFSSLALVWQGPLDLTADDRLPDRYISGYVSPAGFAMLAGQPALGRALREDDDRPGAPPVAVLSHSLWQSRYGGDASIIGRAIHVNARVTTIVGVMPEGFPFPLKVDAWMSISSLPAGFLQRGREARFYSAYGRLADGVTIEQARTDLATVAAQLGRQYPESNREMSATVTPLIDHLVDRDTRTIMWALMGAVVFVLLIACANVANLLLARAAHRSREIAMRLSLGASRGRVVRQLLLESLLLASISGAIGFYLANAAIRWCDVNIQDVGRPSWMTFTMDVRVVGFLVLVCALTAVLFGLAPALFISKTNVQEVLKEGGRAAAGTPRARRWTSALVVAELTLTLVLLSGAGFMMRSFLSLYRMNVGMETSHLLMMRVLASGSKYTKFDDLIAWMRQLDERLNTVQGVEAASTATAMAGVDLRQLAIEGRTVDEGARLPTVLMFSVGPRYFEALGVRLLRGRALTDSDGQSGYEVAIINQRIADLYFPRQDPIGKRIRLSDDTLNSAESPWATVIGVAPTVRYATSTNQMAPEAAPAVYIPNVQNKTHRYGTWLLVRSHAEPSALIAQLRREVAAIDPDMPIADIKSMDDLLADQRWAPRVFGTMFGIFAGIALVLAAVGLYAVTAYAVAQRTSEIGVRKALGARPQDIVWLIARRAAGQVVVGLALGLGGAIVVGHLLKGFLIQVEPTDPTTLVTIALILTIVAAAASFWPSSRAMRLDPAVALRDE